MQPGKKKFMGVELKKERIESWQIKRMETVTLLQDAQS